jgi:hypothetical protein
MPFHHAPGTVKHVTPRHAVIMAQLLAAKLIWTVHTLMANAQTIQVGIAKRIPCKANHLASQTLGVNGMMRVTLRFVFQSIALKCVMTQLDVSLIRGVQVIIQISALTELSSVTEWNVNGVPQRIHVNRHWGMRVGSMKIRQIALLWHRGVHGRIIAVW